MLTFIMAHSQNNKSQKRSQHCKNYCCLCTISAADHAGNSPSSSIMCLLVWLILPPKCKKTFFYRYLTIGLLTALNSLKTRNQHRNKHGSFRLHMRTENPKSLRWSTFPLFRVHPKAKQQVHFMMSFHCKTTRVFSFPCATIGLKYTVLRLLSFLSDRLEIRQQVEHETC